MSITLGNIPIAGLSTRTKYNAHHLLDFKWSDCIMNDVSWLRADTFSWQSGDVYVAAYNHLVADLSGATATTETIGSYTVTFYRADDGHKICLADQETIINNIYTETGIAWYYILDTTNTRFKLPRTKFGFEGVRTNVGDLIEAGLPNIEGSFYMGKSGHTTNGYGVSGAFKSVTATGQGNNAATNGNTYQFNFDASRSSSVYGNSTTVQENATQMYLYFYVGDFSQTAIEQTAGLNSSLFNSKADTDLGNLTSTQSVNFDGQWVFSRLYLVGSTTTISGQTTYTYDLSNYLPDDGKIYDVAVNISCNTDTSSGSMINVYFSSDILTNKYSIMGARGTTRTSSNVSGGGNCILPVGNARELKLFCGTSSGTSMSIVELWVSGYRRLGTNQ